MRKIKALLEKTDNQENEIYFYLIMFLQALPVPILYLFLAHPPTLFSYFIFINPFISYALPLFVLDYLRYKELKEIYKKYTLEQFVKTYENAHTYSFGNTNNFEILSLRPLAKDMLSIAYDCFAIEANTAKLINKEITIENFITKTYAEKFRLKNFCAAFSDCFAASYIGFTVQLPVLGILQKIAGD